MRLTISLLRQKYPKIKIRIGTVVCAINRNNVLGIPDIISDQYRPDIWKLYEFTPASYGYINRAKLEISSQEFENIVNLAKEKSSLLDIPFDAYRRNMRDGMYFFLEPNGDAMVVTDGEEKIIGNCFEDLTSVLKVCTEILNFREIQSQTNTHW